MLQWMVLAAGEVLLKYYAKSRGRAQHHGMMGHRGRHNILGIGGLIHTKLPTGDARRNTFDGEWHDGWIAGFIMAAITRRTPTIAASTLLRS